MIKVIKIRKIIFFVIFFIMFFIIIYYKNFLFGNNIIKNRNSNQSKEILNNFTNYYAEVDVTVKSNKTENVYQINQKVKENYSFQEVKNENGETKLKLEYCDNTLKVINSKLNLEKVYANYNNLLNNSLFLNTFAYDYNNKENHVKCEETENEIIIDIIINSNENTYIKYKKLYINKDTRKTYKT